jgi:nucleoside-triphosphatase THEP1
MTTQPILAAILAEKDVAVDPLLATVAARAGERGLKVAGFLQHRGPDTDECCREIVIERIGSGNRQIISQPLGTGSRGCRLDPAALADVAGSLRAEIEAGADLLILNRFGKGETEGQGFRTVIELAYAKQIPVLTVVRETYVEGWNEFAGDFGVLLAPDQTVLADWLETITPLRALSAVS